ncbi:hypothetical protein [Alishewanella longhuensis]
MNHEQLDRVRQSGKPMLSVDCNLSGMGSVNIDNTRYAYDIALYAMQKQPGKVAVLGLRLIDSDRVCRMQPAELYDQDKSGFTSSPGRLSRRRRRVKTRFTSRSGLAHSGKYPSLR